MGRSDPRDACVLVLAPIGRDALACAELLARGAVQTHIAADLDELVARIDGETGAVVLAEEALFGKDFSALSAKVDAQATWSDLPFLVLTTQLGHAGAAVWRQRLMVSLRNVSLLERPVQAITLMSAVHAALRARARQYEVRALLEAQARAAHGLETLVRERTGELARTNEQLVKQIAERARIEESLRQAQKIEAIGQLTGGVAHDFNNLLMVILGGLEMLDRTAESERRKLLIDGMRQAAERGAALTRQLLAFSRRQPLQPQPTDLSNQIGSMRELLERSLRGDVHIELSFPDDLWPIQVDPGELELVVLNLAVNARDAMPRGGTITIGAANVTASDEGELRGDYVRLSIADTGTGMSDEVKAHLFEPFFTTKDVGKGSGLGLAQVYGFAKQSGGAVHIDSELGRGTCVTLMLPRSQAQPRVERHPRLELDARRARRTVNGSVLLVEDNDEVAALVAGMLDELGYDVTRVASASAALGALANEREVDLVFSDIMMPGDMDGVDLAREIRARRANLPVLLTSGYAEAARDRAEQEGLSVLAKPYRLTDLAAALQRMQTPASGQRAPRHALLS